MYSSYYPEGQTLGSARSNTRSSLPPSEAAAMAALNRSFDSLSLTQTDTQNPMQWEKKDWLRLINDELIAKTSKKQALETLETMIKLVEGVKALPREGSTGTERERTIRLRNPIIKRTIVDVPGAYDLLVRCGFRRSVVDFEQRLTVPRPSSSLCLYHFRIPPLHFTLDPNFLTGQTPRAFLTRRNIEESCKGSKRSKDENHP
ncbi:hypothetical protein JCM16303_005622 [Sporobolomyces ruberrimus]